MSLDVGPQRPAGLPAHIEHSTGAVGCVRCMRVAAMEGSDWCGPCHPRNPNPPPILGGYELRRLMARLSGSA